MELDEKTLQKLKEEKIQLKDLNHDYFAIFDDGGYANNSHDFSSVLVDNILKLLNENICDFKQIIDRLKEIRDCHNVPSLWGALYEGGLVEKLIKDNTLNKEDLKYLLSKIDNEHEVFYFSRNTSLAKHILKKFVLNKEIVDKFSAIIEENYNINTIFELIEYQNKNNEEILRLNELNKYTHSFDENQQLELIELIQNNEIARNRLIQIIDNHLESNFDFESLMVHLKKIKKKNLLSI